MKKEKKSAPNGVIVDKSVVNLSTEGEEIYYGMDSDDNFVVNYDRYSPAALDNLSAESNAEDNSLDWLLNFGEQKMHVDVLFDPESVVDYIFNCFLYSKTFSRHSSSKSELNEN
jgi:hypothetical protein